MDKTVEKLVRARVAMLLHNPFFGNLAVRLKLKDMTDSMPTAGTDGRYFYYNRDFINKLNPKELIFLWAHEVLHCCYQHMSKSRKGSRHHQMWNAANDYVINWELHEHKIGQLPDPKTSGVQICFDEKYKGMCSEQVYDLLDKSTTRISVMANGNGGFDIHFDEDNAESPEGKMTEEEKRELSDEIRQAVMQAAKVDKPGNIPSGIKRLIHDLTEPQMDWREFLNMQIQSAFKSDYTFSRPNRKSQNGIILPGQIPDTKIDVCVSIDCSGSMSDSMLKDLLGEVKGIMEQFLDFKVRLWCFDTAVYGYAEFTPDNLQDIMTYEIKGGGGTAFQCNWDYMRAHDIVPHRFIMMTDGYGESDWCEGEADYCETIFLVHSNSARNLESPHGMTVYYDAPEPK